MGAKNADTTDVQNGKDEEEDRIEVRSENSSCTGQGRSGRFYNNGAYVHQAQADPQTTRW